MARVWFFLSASMFAGTLLGQTPGAMPVASQQALVDKYCAGCHNDKLKTGGFSFTQIDLAHPDLKAEQSDENSSEAARGYDAARRNAPPGRRDYQGFRDLY